MAYVLYKIYSGSTLVYLGRTKQKLQDRLRGHFFAKPMHKKVDIFQTTKIECAEFKTEADMFLYEIYYINKLKPVRNRDDRARDELTVSLPEVNFKTFYCPLMDKWKRQIAKQEKQDAERRDEKIKCFNKMRDARRNGDKEEYSKLKEFYDEAFL